MHLDDDCNTFLCHLETSFPLLNKPNNTFYYYARREAKLCSNECKFNLFFFFFGGMLSERSLNFINIDFPHVIRRVLIETPTVGRRCAFVFC